MNHQAFRKVRLSLGLTAIALVICAFAAVGSAAASTQHWASATPASRIAEGGYQSFTGKNIGSVEMSWRYAGGRIALNCSQMSTSGNASNPTGGGSGTLSGASLELAGCVISVPSCQIVNGSIPFEPLKGYARDVAGQEQVLYQPREGTAMAVVKFANSGGGNCPFGSSFEMTGNLEAASVPSQPGRYRIQGTPNLRLAGYALEMVAELNITATSGQPLALSSEGSPGVPHWYLGGSEWTVLPAGQSSSYFSGAVPLTLSTKVGLAKVEISGCEGFNVGSVENPTGGGAGTASSTFTPTWVSGCQINTPSCEVENASSIELLGKATEVGAVPAVEWSPKSGTAVIVFHLHNKGTTCALGTSITVTGKLIATSKGDGRFNLAASELKVGTQVATASGEFGLETQLGKSLRLQP